VLNSPLKSSNESNLNVFCVFVGKAIYNV